MATDNTPHSILVFREYTDKTSGEVKSRSHEVGTAFKTKDGGGFNCQLVEGIALTGRFTILPRTSRTADDQE